MKKSIIALTNIPMNMLVPLTFFRKKPTMKAPDIGPPKIPRIDWKNICKLD